MCPVLFLIGISMCSLQPLPWHAVSSRGGRQCLCPCSPLVSTETGKLLICRWICTKEMQLQCVELHFQLGTRGQLCSWFFSCNSNLVHNFICYNFSHGHQIHATFAHARTEQSYGITIDHKLEIWQSCYQLKLYLFINGILFITPFQTERLTRTVARSFAPEFSSHFDFSLPLAMADSEYNNLSLAETLEEAMADFEIWHQVPLNSTGMYLMVHRYVLVEGIKTYANGLHCCKSLPCWRHEGWLETLQMVHQHL